MKLLNATVIAASITAIVAFVSKVIELIILWRNKKKEIDYENQAKVKEEIRNITTEIVSASNKMAVAVNTYVSLLEKRGLIISGKKKTVKKTDGQLEYVDRLMKEKIEQMNVSAITLTDYTTQFELRFTTGENEHVVIEKSKEILSISFDFRTLLDNFQESYSAENLGSLKIELERNMERLNKEIPELIKETRFVLKTYKFKIYNKNSSYDRKIYRKRKNVVRLKKIKRMFKKVFKKNKCEKCIERESSEN